MSKLGNRLLACGIVAGIAATAGANADAATKPNVILIMADDLGFETIRANGGTSYSTPVLDDLAAKGVRFTNCYAQPLCTPTRVQLMTGAYNVRNYTTFGEMDPTLTTFGNLFRDAGYSTCIVGKWQLGRDPGLPKRFGFDESSLWQHLRRPPRYANPGLEVNGVEMDFRNGEYGPDLVVNYALDFISRRKDKPFFLYYPMILTHSPYQPTPDSPDWDPSTSGENVNKHPKHFGDMVAYMDKMVGRIVEKLDELGIRENTLLMFLGDNGTGRGTRSKMGDSVVVGGKGLTTRAGMHVPLIVSWPGSAASGKVCEDLVDSTDFLPTICEAARIDVPKSLVIDGKSFLAQVRGEAGTPREWIYSWYSPRRESPKEFAFDHRYKLYRTGEFFDLQNDPTERQPKLASSLTETERKASESLQNVLDAFEEARPRSLDAGGRKRRRP